MPIPQVTDRMKEAPAVALRAVFAGIGQLLMAVDKIRAQMQEQATSSAPGQHRPGAATKSAAGPKATDGTKPAAGPKAAGGTKSAAGPKAAAGAKAAPGAKSAAGPK